MGLLLGELSWGLVTPTFPFWDSGLKLPYDWSWEQIISILPSQGVNPETIKSHLQGRNNMELGRI